MHNAAFAADGADYAYVAMNVQPDRLENAIAGLPALGFAGFNVTMPHKENIASMLDRLDEPAHIAGAVNTVIVRGDELYGMNTDGSGLVEACTESGGTFAGKQVIVLGAGGAAAAVSVAILGEGAQSLVIANRSPGRAENLQEKLAETGAGTELRVTSLERIAEEATKADVIVNTTYLGMRGQDPVPLPTECLDREKVVCDAVYLRDEDTDLIRRAREAGATVVPGDEMLLYQGVQAQRAWTGREPNVEVMKNAISR